MFGLWEKPGHDSVRASETRRHSAKTLNSVTQKVSGWAHGSSTGFLLHQFVVGTVWLRVAGCDCGSKGLAPKGTTRAVPSIGGKTARPRHLPPPGDAIRQAEPWPFHSCGCPLGEPGWVISQIPCPHLKLGVGHFNPALRH